MNCQRCGAEMRETIAHRFVGATLESTPGYECLNCGMLFVNGEWVDMRAAPDDDADEADDDTPPPPDPFGGHVGFYADDGTGSAMHILGDPNMSDETLKALQAMAQAAKRMIDRGE